MKGLCTKCNNNYYEIENDKNNIGEYINCYKDPEGYYLDIIDSLYKKCYYKCKTCEIRGNEESHNCLTCSNEFPVAINFNESNNYKMCYEKCNNYYYFNCDTNQKCIINSIYLNVYPKNIKEAIFQNGNNICLEEVPENFYLDNNDNIYKECYNTCKTCDKSGNENINNCIECINNYIFLNESFIPSKNCFRKCDHYYYFNENNQYICTESKNCPLQYSKLIKEKNKCINDCKNGELEGYYLDLDKNNNDCIYKKCYYTCKSCVVGGNYLNHNCQKCKSEYFFGLNNTYNYLNCYENNDSIIYFSDNTLYYNFINDSSNSFISNGYDESLQIKSICNETYPFLIKNEQKCVDFCDIDLIKMELCIYKYTITLFNITDENNGMNNKEKKERIKLEEIKAQDIKLKNIEKGITSNKYNTTNIEKGIDDIIIEEKMIITITTSENSKNNYYNKNDN
jgi:hypothetical protein